MSSLLKTNCWKTFEELLKEDVEVEEHFREGEAGSCCWTTGVIREFA